MFSEPFRGSVAIARGLVTRMQLRGPHFRRLFQDIYVSALVEVDLALRSRGAYLLVAGRGGAVGGWSAAELLGASCGPAHAPAEVIVHGRQRPQPGLRILRAELLPSEVTDVGGVTVTTPLRTAFDLARRKPLLDAVVALDALSDAFDFPPREVINFGYDHLGAHGSAQLQEVVGLANPLAESPMETRIRLAIHVDGLPPPVLQHPVGPYHLDMAYPAIKLGVEYDGREHLTQERALRDLDRQAYLTASGWKKILRFRAGEVLHRPTRVAATVRGELIRAGRLLDLSLAELTSMITANGTSGFAPQP